VAVCLSGISFAWEWQLSSQHELSLGLDVPSLISQSGGDQLTIELEVENQQPKTLLRPRLNPLVLGQPVQAPIETMPHQSYQWVYYYPTQRRGVYRWQTVQLRNIRWDCSGAAVATMIPATAIVYVVLPLSSCPGEMRQKILPSLQPRPAFSDSNRRVNAIAAPLPNRRSNSSDSLAD